MKPRYQIFISSTFRDLVEERQSILEAILELGHFPSGMEAFPAADATPWDLIKSIISESDYYVLVVGGRYGSTGTDGISYTEMEYDYAVSCRLPILVFLHGAPELIPSGRTELEPSAREKLSKFRAKVSKHHCKNWKTKDDLKSAVLLSIVHIERTNPAKGWVRNEGLQNQELLQRLANLQSKYGLLEDEHISLKNLVGDKKTQIGLQGLSEKLNLELSHTETGTPFHLEVKLSQLFNGVAESILTPARQWDLHDELKMTIFDFIRNTDLEQYLDKNLVEKRGAAFALSVKSPTLERIIYKFMALGLIEPLVLQVARRTSGGGQTLHNERHWVLTDIGKNYFATNGQ
jgi:hypothetical protein